MQGFTQPHFDYVAGIFTGHSVTSRDAYQMLGRVRYATELHLFIDQKFTPYIDAGTKQAAWQNLSGESGTALTDLIATIQANNELDKANLQTISITCWNTMALKLDVRNIQ